MGMNYYYHESGEETCPHCRQRTPFLHVGKSSYGWCFSLRVHPDIGIRGLADWQTKWAEGGLIRDEDGDPVTPAQMSAVIADRPADWRRHGSDACGGQWTTTPGAGTYDLCDYEFC